jgi:hypothetical protein
VLDDDGRVGHRVGVGHGEDGGEPAQGGGGRAGGDVLGLLAAGLAQMDVQVDEAGEQDRTAAVEQHLPVEVGRDRADLPVLDADVDGVPAVRADVADDHAGAPASRW